MKRLDRTILSGMSGEPLSVNKWAVLGTVMLGLFMVVLDSNIVIVALPAMMHSFHTTQERVKLTVEAYSLSYAIFTLTGAWLRERLGIRNTFLAGLALFTATSMLCGIAWSLPSMIVFRILQGVGGGIMMPTGFTLLSESFPPHERGTAFGIFGLVIVFAPSIGPTLGGWLVDNTTWRYVFFINLPVGILTFVMALSVMKELRKLHPARFDLAGFMGLGACLAFLLTALNEVERFGWSSPIILTFLVAAALGFAVFVIVNSRVKQPIFPLNFFKNYYVSILTFLHTLRCLVLFGRMVLIPMMFLTIFGHSAMATGLLLIPGAMASGLTMPLVGPLVDRFSPKYFIFSGFILQSVACFMYHDISASSSYMATVAPLILFGIGTGMSATPTTTATMNVVSRRQIGLVSIAQTVLMQVAGAFGIAIFSTMVAVYAAGHSALRVSNVVLTAVTPAPGTPAATVDAARQAMLHGYQHVYVFMGWLCLLALLPALGIVRIKASRKRKPETPAPAFVE